ncbi:CobB/CobQ-like glutamine amidotransferase domain-containing protein [Lentinula boryana]|uniref:phosphoribosylformylglycinamidine synthase n=1 Tax=Lentinula boryana TaxID=40481 RepID=A0ABQ8Q5G2_9AGAR|nr:CobB/CobQ-like glutamine amidotransferase domain-containing protein [Lentinula boryana]
MLLLLGNSSISQQKREILLENIKRLSPSVTSVDSLWLHLVKCTSEEVENELSNPASSFRQILDQLLNYGDDVTLDHTIGNIGASQRNIGYVLPRLGSISPWSSKATDIAAICNLSSRVERIERGIAYVFTTSDNSTLSLDDISPFSHLIHDRMTQTLHLSLPNENLIFSHKAPRPLRAVDIATSSAKSAEDIFRQANVDLGLALSPDEIAYLVSAFISGPNPINRNPTDAELFMFAQVNSEHCRHKIFNAIWTLNSTAQDLSLFQMIRNTERLSGGNTISAYSDNASVFKGHVAPRFNVSSDGGLLVYRSHLEEMPILIKVETHNHPTAVSPYPGAATGSGGEIRDEGAVGRGSKPKAGLAGFATSNLLIPGFEQPWEEDFGKPAHIASAMDIMMEAPLGASAFNNEFGRPALAGFFRTFCEKTPSNRANRASEVRGYHKPIMIAGGYGNVRLVFAKKSVITPGAKLAVLGGPGMLIGLGGGAASSQVSGASSAELDFASVQRDNAEMQRRCQQVIDACVALGGEAGDGNPIQSIHDVGAGGLSNALPELVHDSNLGGTFEIREVLVADSSMSPMEIWCNESQERYVLALHPEKLPLFEQIANRERCPFAIVGIATEDGELVVTDRLLGRDVIRLKMDMLFGNPPKMERSDWSRIWGGDSFDTSLAKYHSSTDYTPVASAVNRILRLPSVGSKSFLITIGDRTITGLVTRDQMVGPWQIPVADVAVTRSSYGFDIISGEAMAMGERTPLALVSPVASARMAVAESLTNLAAAYVGELSNVKLSANWMCAASKEGEGAGLYEAVQAIGMDLCPKLGIGIPVGKDSMSMSMKWKEGNVQKEVSSPLSLIVTAFGSVEDVTATWTPVLQTNVGEPTVLVFLDLAHGKQRLGGSALAQVFREIGQECPDVEDASVLKAFFQACQKMRMKESEVVLAYHDRSDGGLFTTLAEMSFAGRVGVEISLDALNDSSDPIAALFNEELGAVMQVRQSHLPILMSIFIECGFPSTSIHTIGHVNNSSTDQSYKILHDSEYIFNSSRQELQQLWAETSFRMQELRDNSAAAKEEFALIADQSYRGLFYDLTFTSSPSVSCSDNRPKVAILREQGVNGMVEMAWSFSAAGFDAIDVHMTDILSGALNLSGFRGIAACGGFSYGDVLGAGKGWAHSVLLNDRARKEFIDFFTRDDTFTLAVCNGCQFLSHLRSIIPGAHDWPDFKSNLSERFEGRVSMVEVVDTVTTRSSVFLRDMVGSKLPVANAHGEGRVSFIDSAHRKTFFDQNLVGLRFVDAHGKPTEVYPLNPNGSPAGITGVQTPDGRVLALMPHPERVTMLESNSWYPRSLRKEWKGMGPWFKLFQSARSWCDNY